MKVTRIPIIIGVLGTVPKGLVKRLERLEIGGRVETIQTPVLWNTKKSSGDLRRLVTDSPSA